MQSHVDEVTLLIENLTDVHTKLFDARASWFNIGLVLKVSYGTLKSIESEQHNNSDRLREILTDRILSENSLTWSVLCSCLRQVTVGHSDVADEIEELFKGDNR